MTQSVKEIQPILEAAIFSAGEPLSLDKLQHLFDDGDGPSAKEIKAALELLSESMQERGVELVEVASGYRFQAKTDYAPWLKRLWEKKPPRYSRALLETLALVVYRQPITRGEIEDVRGVAVSTHIMKVLLEREWVKIVGHRDVPGKPALFGTTKQFLDYFNLKSLSELPPLEDVADLEALEKKLGMQLQFDDTTEEPQDQENNREQEEPLVETDFIDESR